MPRITAPVVASGSLAKRHQPTLEVDDDLHLRAWLPADAPAVANAYADPDIRHWHARSMTEDEAREWVAAWAGRWRAESAAGWAIADRSGVVGQISLRRLSLAEGEAEISYWVLPAARGGQRPVDAHRMGAR